MDKQSQLYTSEASEWLGNLHPLVEQLGSADGLVCLASVASFLKPGPLNTLPSVRKFLRNYQQNVLFPCELPAIESAYDHALRNETRELIALDHRLANETLLRDFAAASRRVGQSQLQKLRPLRDQRLVQRYLTAVEDGRAHGWHTLVYGITLAIYSLPLRQGLLGYAQQSTRSFIHSAARSLHFSEKTSRKLFDEAERTIPAGRRNFAAQKGGCLNGDSPLAPRVKLAVALPELHPLQ
jgi:urease accessory protein UreF